MQTNSDPAGEPDEDVDSPTDAGATLTDGSSDGQASPSDLAFDRDVDSRTEPVTDGATPRYHIAFYLPSFATGGAQRVTVTIANGVAARGHRVDLLVSLADGPLRDEVTDAVRIVDLETPHVPGIGTLAAVPGLVSYIRRTGPDVLFSAMLQANVVAILSRAIARGLKGPVPTRLVATEHNTFGVRRGPRNRVTTALADRLYPHADRIVGVSEGVAHSVRRGTRVDPSAVAVLYNPIDVAAIRTTAGLDPVEDDESLADGAGNGGAGPEQLVTGARDAADVEVPWADGEGPVVFTVGRIEDAKDVPTLLRAFERVHAVRPDARLVVAGTGSRLEALRRRAAASRSADAVTFTGYVENAYAAMAAADLFVLSSRHEGLPTVLLEALACGTPVVSTDCPSGPREILSNGELGPLVPVGDDEALAEAILETLADPIDSARLVGRAQEFSVEVVTDEYVSFVRDVLE